VGECLSCPRWEEILVESLNSYLELLKIQTRLDQDFRSIFHCHFRNIINFLSFLRLPSSFRGMYNSLLCVLRNKCLFGLYVLENLSSRLRLCRSSERLSLERVFESVSIKLGFEGTHNGIDLHVDCTGYPQLVR